MANTILGYWWDNRTYTGPGPVPSGFQDASHNEIGPQIGTQYTSFPHITNARIPSPAADHMTLDLSPLQPFTDYQILVPQYDPITGHVYGEIITVGGVDILAPTQSDPAPIIYDPDDLHVYNMPGAEPTSYDEYGHTGCGVWVRFSILQADGVTPASCMSQSIAKQPGLHDDRGVSAPSPAPPQMPAGSYDQAVPANIVQSGNQFSLRFDKHWPLGQKLTIALSPDADHLNATIGLLGFHSVGANDTVHIPIFSLPNVSLDAPTDNPYQDPSVDHGLPVPSATRITT